MRPPNAPGASIQVTADSRLASVLHLCRPGPNGLRRKAGHEPSTTASLLTEVNESYGRALSEDDLPNQQGRVMRRITGRRQLLPAAVTTRPFLHKISSTSRSCLEIWGFFLFHILLFAVNSHITHILLPYISPLATVSILCYRIYLSSCLPRAAHRRRRTRKNTMRQGVWSLTLRHHSLALVKVDAEGGSWCLGRF